MSFGVLFGVIYGFFGFLGGFGGFRWFFDGFPLGFCWVSVEFSLSSHWLHLIGFVLGSLSLPGPEHVSSGVLFGVIFGFFGFLGGFGGFCCVFDGFLLSSRWVPVGFTLASSSFWVCFGFFVTSRSRNCEFWGSFWGYLGFLRVLGGFVGPLMGFCWDSVGFLLSSRWVHIGFILLGLFWGLCLFQVQNV